MSPPWTICGRCDAAILLWRERSIRLQGVVTCRFHERCVGARGQPDLGDMDCIEPGAAECRGQIGPAGTRR